MLLGRGRERHELEKALADARLSRSAVLVLAGEIGIGKTTLLEFAADRARSAGMRVLRARGIESEAHVPFAGLLELLRPALAELERIPEPQRAALEGALALRPATAQDRFAVGAATLNLLAAHAEDAPVAAFVDDAHWLDASSADALLFAIRRLVADPIAVVVAVREGEPSFVDGAALPTLRLGGLDRAAAAELVGEDAVDRLYAATSGNPLALLELAPEAARLTDLPIDAPVPIAGSVAQGFVRRAGSLSEPTRKALLVAAASDTGELQALERAFPGAVQELLPAESAGLVTLQDGQVEFSHVLVRSAVYGAAAPEERRAAHRALAGALPDRDADRRAWHLALAAVGPDEAASSALWQAGDRAYERSAYAVAAAAYERAALLSLESAALVHRAADAAWLAGQAERALSLLDDAVPGEDDLSLALAIDHLRGQITARRGPVAEAQSILAAAAERAAVADPERAVVMLAQGTRGASGGNRRLRLPRRRAMVEPRTYRARGDGRDRPEAGPVDARPADAPRAPGRPAPRRRPHHSGGGGLDVSQPEDDRVPPAQRLPEARRPLAPRARRGGRSSPLEVGIEHPVSFSLGAAREKA